MLIWRFFSKSPPVRKRLNIILVALIMFFGNAVIFTKLVIAWQPKPVQLPAGKSYEAGILLGGAGSFDRYGNGFLNNASDRFAETAILYKTGKIKRIIISGGNVFKGRPKEADFVYRKFIDLGIPAQDLIAENRSQTTFENAVFTKKIVDSLKLGPPFILVTSAMHVPRAQRVFAKAGLPVIAFPCAYQVLDKRFSFYNYIIPQVGIIDLWSNFLKEIVGVIGYKFFNKA